MYSLELSSCIINQWANVLIPVYVTHMYLGAIAFIYYITDCRIAKHDSTNLYCYTTLSYYG